MRQLGAPIASSRPKGRHDHKSGNASSGQNIKKDEFVARR